MRLLCTSVGYCVAALLFLITSAGCDAGACLTFQHTCGRTSANVIPGRPFTLTVKVNGANTPGGRPVRLSAYTTHAACEAGTQSGLVPATAFTPQSVLTGASGVAEFRNLSAQQGGALFLRAAVNDSHEPVRAACQRVRVNQHHYRAVEINPGAIEGPIPSDISDRGDVVGTVQLRLPDGSLATKAFRWTKHDLRFEVLAEVTPIRAVAPYFLGASINSAGIAVGTAYSLLPPYPHEPVAWVDSTQFPLLPLMRFRDPTSSNEAMDVSDSNIIVGTGRGFQKAPEDTYAYAYSQREDVVHELTLPAGVSRSRAERVNESGWVAGTARFPGSVDQHAFLWKPPHAATDLGTLGGVRSEAAGINDAKTVVGSSQVLPGSLLTRAFFYSNGTMQDLGALPGHQESRARDINNCNEVIGESRGALQQWQGLIHNARQGNIVFRPLIENGEYDYLELKAINNKGEIAAYGTRGSEQLLIRFSPIE